MTPRLLTLLAGLLFAASVSVSSCLTQFQVARQAQLTAQCFQFEQQRDAAMAQRDKLLQFALAQQEEIKELYDFYKKHQPQLAAEHAR